MKISQSLFAAMFCLAASLTVLPVRADRPSAEKQTAAPSIIIKAQGHPKHLDFTARSSKRADLRSDIQRKGVDVAFTEWLRAEHPHVYKRHAAEIANRQTTDKIALR